MTVLDGSTEAVDEDEALKQERQRQVFTARETQPKSSSVSRFYIDYLSRLETRNVDDSKDEMQVLFSGDALVFFFIDEENDWCERGYGVLQILRHGEKYHVFMSDHSKVYVAHQLKPSMDLKPNAGSDRSWVWFTLEEHSEGEVIARKLAVEFQSVELSYEFKKKFEECRDHCGVPHEGHVRAMAASFDSNMHKLPTHGTIPVAANQSQQPSSHHVASFLPKNVDPHKLPSRHILKAESTFWRTCLGCEVENCAENTSCLVCGEHFTAKDTTKINTLTPHLKPSSRHRFKRPLPTPKQVVPRDSRVKQGRLKPAPHWWKCVSCEVENNVEISHCLMCSTSRPSLSCFPEMTAMLDEILTE